MRNFIDSEGSRDFEVRALPYLRGAVQRFFGARVKYDSQPIESLLRKHGIDILANPKQGVYTLPGDRCALVLGRVFEGRIPSRAFSLQLEDFPVEGMQKLLHVFASALSRTLTQAAKYGFDRRPHEFGDELIELAVAQYFSRGYYDPRKFRQLIEVFRALSNTRFEGRSFTTGLLLTKSHYAFANEGKDNRDGTMLPLCSVRKISASDQLDKRFWYLVDGQTSFFLASPWLEIGSIFLAEGVRSRPLSFVDDFTLSSTVRGGDALFRVLSHAEISITSSSGVDFNFKEGSWRARNISQVARIVQQTLDVSTEVVQSLLFYVFYLSRRRLSSIIWIPSQSSIADNLVLSRNKLTQSPLSILDPSHTQTIIRLVSSDGAAILDRTGAVSSFGSVVDTSSIKVAGMKGTGESVASLLGRSGVCVKVSQDGTIKIFSESLAAALVL